MKNLLRELFLHGTITTTQAKAKELKRQVDSVIVRSKTDSVVNRRVLHKQFGKRDISNALVAVIAPAFKKRDSGFVTISPAGIRRGDATPLFKVTLLEQRERLGTFKPKTPNIPKKTVAVEKSVAKKPAATTKKKSITKKK